MTTTSARPALAAARQLRRGAEVRAVLAQRRTAHGSSCVVHALTRGDTAPARWTVVAGRKVGGAVQRNRAKRRLRAVLAALPLPAGVDLVVIARADAVAVPFPALTAELADLTARAVARSAR